MKSRARQTANRRRAPLLVVGLAVLFTGTGCSVNEHSTPRPESPSATVVETPELVDTLLEWETIAGPSDELGTLEDVRPDRFAAEIRYGSWFAVAIFDSDGTRLEYPVPENWVIQRVFIIGDDVVFGVSDEGAREFRIFRWDGGETAELLHESVGPDSYWSETAVDGTDLYLTTRHDDGYCIDRMDLSQAQPNLEQVTCAEPGFEPWWLFVQDETLSFVAMPGDSGCGILHRMALPTGPVEAVESMGCVSRGIATSEIAIWSEAPPESDTGIDFFRVQLWAMHGTTKYDLGRGIAGSSTICDETAYWSVEREPPDHPIEIRRWSPGDPIEVIYRSPDEDFTNGYATSRPGCTNGIVFIQRFGWWAYAGEEFLTTPGLGWTADAIPAAPRPAG